MLTASLVYQEWPIPLRTTLIHSIAHSTSAGLSLRTFLVLAPACHQTLQESLWVFCLHIYIFVYTSPLSRICILSLSTFELLTQTYLLRPFPSSALAVLTLVTVFTCSAELAHSPSEVSCSSCYAQPCAAVTLDDDSTQELTPLFSVSNWRAEIDSYFLPYAQGWANHLKPSRCWMNNYAPSKHDIHQLGPSGRLDFYFPTLTHFEFKSGQISKVVGDSFRMFYRFLFCFNFFSLPI